ncbi:hypothetical protein THRCLA_08727 [Thraustotheca clavata]|uniref:Uncharacterized protein n=1 Tax=Thraustotheca clavata TaxID=74557 RepID=A0A1V9Z2P4_9STRA|nr:hypothetical protein THRCLA_08727 [Thraustotheca clavata]
MRLAREVEYRAINRRNPILLLKFLGSCKSKLKYVNGSVKVSNDLSLLVRHAVDGHLDELRDLCKRKPRLLKTIDRFGMTALHWGEYFAISSMNLSFIVACYAGKLPAVIILIEYGSNVNQTDAHQRNALHQACRKGHTDMIEYLVIVHGMDVDCKSKNGDTPLHKAVLSGSPGATLLLLYYGADPHIKNSNNMDAIQEAQQKIKQTILRAKKNTHEHPAEKHHGDSVEENRDSSHQHVSGDGSNVQIPFGCNNSTTEEIPVVKPSNPRRTLRASTTKVILHLRQKQALGQYEVIAQIFNLYEAKKIDSSVAEKWNAFLEEYTKIRI